MSGLPPRNGTAAAGVGFRCEIVECASRDLSPVLRLSPQMATGLTRARMIEACNGLLLSGKGAMIEP
jgi:hypothetical protein